MTEDELGWVASHTQWTLVWASSERWWTGKSAVLQSMGSRKLDMTENKYTEFLR